MSASQDNVRSTPNHTLALIAFGSNRGDRHANLRQASVELTALGIQFLQKSRVYETLPIGGCKGMFLNSVALVQSPFSPDQLLLKLLAVELKMGRSPKASSLNESRGPAVDREIDLDLLLAQDLAGHPFSSNLDHLQIPHPRMLTRDFVMVPAAEIAASWSYPGTGQTLGELNRWSGAQMQIFSESF